MIGANQIVAIYEDSFTANLYTINHFRMIGFIDVRIASMQGTERVSLGFYSSSGTNNGKISGLWYPIVGIKTVSGPFVEFTDCINTILTETTYHGTADEGWLAKSLFFYGTPASNELQGFSHSHYAPALLKIGKRLSILYEEGQFIHLAHLAPATLNRHLMSQEVYPGNHYTQGQNFNRFIQEIYMEASSRVAKDTFTHRPS